MRSGNQTNAGRLREFHTALGENLPTSPTLPTADVLRLRQTLIREEYEEVTAVFSHLLTAPQQADFVHLMHELADLLYVTYGTMVACGVDADAVFAEVHRANMEKLGGPRRADGKLLKPPGWQPANVQGVLERNKEG